MPKKDLTIEMDVSDQKNKMWDFKMSYYDIGDQDADTINNMMGGLADYVKNHAGSAQAADKKYSVNFSYTAAAGKKVTAKQDNLLY
jgi:hypothetical protein